MAAAIGILASLPVLAAALSVVGREWFPTGDFAFIARHVADVGGRHTPLVGVYSRFGFDHPGPLLFWALAPFQHLGGYTGSLVGAAIINAACLAGALVVAHRRGGVALVAWVALLLVVLCHALGPAMLVDPWNARLPVTGLVLFMMLSWVVACGDAAMWPWLAGIASWLVQAHIGYAPVVGSLVIFAVISQALGSRQSTTMPGGQAKRAILQTLAVVVLLWAPPVVQQLTGHPGNLTAIATWTLHDKGPFVGLSHALHIAGRQLALPPPWITGRETTTAGLLAGAPVWSLAGQVLVLLAAGWAAWRRRQRDAALLAGVSLLALVAGVFALDRISGPAFPYVARWIWVIAMFVPLATGWCLATLLPPRRVLLRVTAFGLLATTAFVALLTAAQARTTQLPTQTLSDALAVLVPPTERTLPRHRSYGVVQVEPFGGGLGIGLQAALEGDGYRVFLSPFYALAAGKWRTTSLPTDGTLISVALASARTGYRIPPSWVRVAHWDPLSPSERAQANALEDSIRRIAGANIAPSTQVLADAPFNRVSYHVDGVPVAMVDQLARLQHRGAAYDIYLGPPSPP